MIVKLYDFGCFCIPTQDLKWASLEDITNRCKTVAFRTASYLTDPICKSRECYYMAAIVDEIYPATDTIQKICNVVRRWSFLVGCGLYGVLGTITTLPGIALRSLTANFSKEPFLYTKGDAAEKMLTNSFSLLSWNVCFPPGGYSITDGGVVSYYYRQEGITEEILKQDADVICLYETFDTASAMDLAERLKEKYAHIYCNIAPRSIGTSSGIFIASKFAIDDFTVDLFPEDTLIGTTKYSAKAIAGFRIGKSAQIFTTHAQHGEEPEFPTKEEVDANRRQMQILIEKVKGVRNQKLPVVVCGDLNVSRRNLELVPGLTLVTSPTDFEYPNTLILLDGNKDNKTPTWGGDASCAPRFYGKKASTALELDYVLARNVKKLTTKILETGYNPNIVTFEASSDHNPLLSEVVF